MTLGVYKHLVYETDLPQKIVFPLCKNTGCSSKIVYENGLFFGTSFSGTPCILTNFEANLDTDFGTIFYGTPCTTIIYFLSWEPQGFSFPGWKCFQALEQMQRATNLKAKSLQIKMPKIVVAMENEQKQNWASSKNTIGNW